MYIVRQLRQTKIQRNTRCILQATDEAIQQMLLLQLIRQTEKQHSCYTKLPESINSIETKNSASNSLFLLSKGLSKRHQIEWKITKKDLILYLPKVLNCS